MSDDPPPNDYYSDDEESTAGLTHLGRIRESNQDHFLIAQLNKSMRVSATSLSMDERLDGVVQGDVMLVADGMGGHPAGHKASQLAIEYLVRRLLNSIHWHFHGDDAKEIEFVKALQELIRNAHTRILLESAQHMDQRGMGTTLTMAYLVWPTLYVVHAGDSRCYLIRDGSAEQLTTDHTMARQMVESGGMKPEDEADSRWSNVLWNVLGGRSNGELLAEVRRIDLQVGDAIVLCSDGLHRYVQPESLAGVVSDSLTPAQACARLVEMANQAGGVDNITVVVSCPKHNEISKSTWVDHFDSDVPGSQPAGDERKHPDPLADTQPDGLS